MPTKRERVWEKTKGHCHLCAKKLKKDGRWHVDHIIPRRYKHSSDEVWNLLPVCDFCNRMKMGAGPQKLRRVMMYGRYCLAEVKRDSDLGNKIREMVGRRAKTLTGEGFRLWKLTPHRKKVTRQ